MVQCIHPCCHAWWPCLWNASHPETCSGSCHGLCLHISPHLPSTGTGLPVSNSQSCSFLLWSCGWASGTPGHAAGFALGGELAVGSAGLGPGLCSPEGTEDSSEGVSAWQVGHGEAGDPCPWCPLRAWGECGRARLPSPAVSGGFDEAPSV